MSLIKKPSAWVPLVLSLAMLGVFGLYVAGIIPPDPAGDEGTAAHLFQFWLVLEAFTVIFFAAKWLPESPKQAFPILLIQILAILALCSPVYLLQL